MKISTDSIQGFAEMSDADKVTALLGLDVPDPVDMSQFVDKKTFDAKASEAADLSKRLKAKMSEEEQNAAERDAKWAEMEAKLKALELEKTISTYKASYLAMNGYDEKLAEDTAKALAEGDMAKVFANQQKANAAYEKKLRADLVKQDPKPDGAGNGNDTKDPAVEYARKLGQQRAEANKAAAEGLKNYL